MNRGIRSEGSRLPVASSLQVFSASSSESKSNMKRTPGWAYSDKDHAAHVRALHIRCEKVVTLSIL